jgi:hypothetical protein
MIRRLGAPYPLLAAEEERVINCRDEDNGSVLAKEVVRASCGRIATQAWITVLMIMVQLKTLVSLTLHFCGDVVNKSMISSNELLDELQVIKGLS